MKTQLLKVLSIISLVLLIVSVPVRGDSDRQSAQAYFNCLNDLYLQNKITSLAEFNNAVLACKSFRDELNRRLQTDSIALQIESRAMQFFKISLRINSH